MSKPVEKANNDKNQRIRHHNNLVAQLINDFSNDRRKKEAENSGYGKQQADDRSRGPIKQNQHIRAKREKHLLSRSVENLKEIIFCVFLPKIESPLCLVCFTAACQSEGKYRSKGNQNCGDSKNRPIRNHAGNEQECSADNQKADQAVLLHDGAV